jgi:hypothetical protein
MNKLKNQDVDDDDDDDDDDDEDDITSGYGNIQNTGQAGKENVQLESIINETSTTYSGKSQRGKGENDDWPSDSPTKKKSKTTEEGGGEGEEKEKHEDGVTLTTNNVKASNKKAKDDGIDSPRIPEQGGSNNNGMYTYTM